MTSGWIVRGTMIRRDFPPEESSVLESLARGLDETLAAADRETPDAVLDRLLPRAYDPDEVAASAEFAAHTRERVVDGKRERLTGVVAALGEGAATVELSPDDAQRWLLALNDMRLALAERIGPERLDDPLIGPVGDVYGWLGWLQAGLLDELIGMR